MSADQTSSLSETQEIARLREALRSSEARFRSVVEGTPHGVIIQQDGRVVYVNPAMAVLFAYPSPEAMLQIDPFSDLIDEPDLTEFRERTTSVYRGARVTPHPGWRGKRKDGRVLWISSAAHQSEWLGRTAVTSFYFDITERKLAELALQESEARYRTALIAGRMGSWETDFATGRRQWSEEAMALFGISLPDGIGCVGGPQDEYASAIHPEDRHMIADLYAAADHSDSFLADYRILRPCGSVAWLSGRGQVVARYPDGKAKRLVSIMTDVTDRKTSELQIRHLMRELSHRSKNLLAVVQSIARQTARTSDSLADFEDRFGCRLQSLAASHDVLVRRNWNGAPLGELVRQQLAPFLESDSPRVTVAGPDVVVTAEAAQAIGMALHELATNAIKHGALSQPAGAVEIAWRIDGKASSPSLTMSWVESGGPLVEQPATRGFGNVVLQSLVPNALHGAVSIDYARRGLRWSLTIPGDHLTAGR